ncbi:hypothetical protein [Lewinella cohaerens]|uniref:hypothetical protein n=1 Tax=Lewinella cohaerens TaxID=70995 RepID=UPI00036B1645|nr:hypothetical protein [Lewinella cohaerens]
MKNTYFLPSLNSISVYEKFVDPSSKKEIDWALVLHSVDPVTGVVNLVVETFFDQRIDLQFTKEPNGYYSVVLENEEPSIHHHLHTLLKGDKPTYSFQNTLKNKVGLTVITDDWNLYLEGYTSEFDIEQAAAGIKVTIDAEGITNHEIWYGVEEVPPAS